MKSNKDIKYNQSSLSGGGGVGGSNFFKLKNYRISLQRWISNCVNSVILKTSAIISSTTSS